MPRKPVFVLGCARSGTTILHRVLAAHEKLAWISQFVNRRPQRPGLACLNRIYALPVFGKRLFLHARGIKGAPVPVEPWNFWHTYLRNFLWEKSGPTPPRRRTPDDVTPEEINAVRSAVDRVCRWQGRLRFLAKYNNFPRMNYLLAAFDDACFVHIVRDPRAVLSSFGKRMRHGEGDFVVWDHRDWWAEALPAEWQAEWREHHHSPFGLAAYLSRFFLRQIRDEARTLPKGRYVEFRYGDFVEHAEQTLKRAFEVCGLPYSRRFGWHVKHIPLSNMNRKWRQVLTEEEQDRIASIYGDDLNEFAAEA